MRHFCQVLVASFIFTLLICDSAQAQLDLTGRFSLHVNGGIQNSLQEFQADLVFSTYGETGRFQTDHRIEGGAIFDAGGHVQLWRALSLGISFTSLNTSDSASLIGSVPHPLRFDSARTVGPQSVAFEQRERATHLHTAWRFSVPGSEHLDVTISAGPSFFNVTRETLSNISVNEVGVPFSEVLVNVGKREHASTGWGAHVGTDITYMLTRMIGIGGFARFSTGTINVPITDDQVPLEVGGTQARGGLRFRF